MAYVGPFPLSVKDGGTGGATFTNHGVLVGAGTSDINALAVGTNGQVLIAATGADPAFASITAGTNITLTPGANSLQIDASGGASTFTTDSGNASESAGTIVINGDGGNISTSGATDVVTITMSANPTFTTMNIPKTTDSSTGIIKQNGSAFLHTFAGSFKDNIFMGGNAGNFTTTGNANLGIGYSSLLSLVDGGFNVGLGDSSLQNVTSGVGNVAVGVNAGTTLGAGGYNVAIGFASLTAGTSAANNIAIGTTDGATAGALFQLVSGSNNIAIGPSAGTNYTTSESSNIVIGNNGTLAESNVIRIGTTGSGSGQQNKCFVAGIFGITVGGSGVPVVVDNVGQLGTVVSSIRFKENVQDLPATDVLKLRPVTFNYINDPSKTLSWGLIAEEVQKVMPGLVVYDPLNQPMTVRYNDLPVLLLAEIKKLVQRIENLEKKLQ